MGRPSEEGSSEHDLQDQGASEEMESSPERGPFCQDSSLLDLGPVSLSCLSPESMTPILLLPNWRSARDYPFNKSCYEECFLLLPLPRSLTSVDLALHRGSPWGE